MTKTLLLSSALVLSVLAVPAMAQGYYYRDAPISGAQMTDYPSMRANTTRTGSFLSEGSRYAVFRWDYYRDRDDYYRDRDNYRDREYRDRYHDRYDDGYVRPSALRGSRPHKPGGGFVFISIPSGDGGNLQWFPPRADRSRNAPPTGRATPCGRRVAGFRRRASSHRNSSH